MGTLAWLVVVTHLMAGREIPAGAPLHIRLTAPIGSYAGKPGMSVSAVLIEPVMEHNEVVLPMGSSLNGVVRSVSRVGLGFRHETASLLLDFERLTLPDGTALPVGTRVAEVDNGRERVQADGRIHGVRATGSICFRVSGYLRMAMAFEVHAEMAEWALKSLIVQLPEPEIYYPAGTELTLATTSPIFVGGHGAFRQAPAAGEEERSGLRELALNVPRRSYMPETMRPSDLTNVLFVGSRAQIEAAFRAAGWTEAQPATLRRRIRFIRAAAEEHGYDNAPMSPLLVNDAEADMSWQKGLNDVAKRHHIRIWKQSATWNGREIWAGAATRDVDFAYFRPGSRLTHQIDPNVDQERDKVAYDLAFTSCAGVLDWAPRPDLPREAWNATGDPMNTDSRMVVLGMRDCPTPRLIADTSSPSIALPAHGGGLQRLARREVLSLRSDLLRDNLFWRTLEATRWVTSYCRRRYRRAHSLASARPNPTLAYLPTSTP